MVATKNPGGGARDPRPPNGGRSELEAYECLDVLGEGTYGVVLKARHRKTGKLVAIKQFKKLDGNQHVQKVTTREVRLLKQLRHPNIIRLLEVIRDSSEGIFYLVFEYVQRTVLECLEETDTGIEPILVRRYMYQLLRCLEYCHASNVIHRDVKPENILISSDNVVKVCDFGFARLMLSSSSLGAGSNYTDYVATRWYRAPELLIGKTDYTAAVDVWAVGCVFAELTTKDPLFPGSSDVNQLAHIVAVCGGLPQSMKECFYRNPLYRHAKLPTPTPDRNNQLAHRFRHQPPEWRTLLKACLQLEPEKRLSCSELLRLEYFTQDGFHTAMDEELKSKGLYFRPLLPNSTPAEKKSRKPTGPNLAASSSMFSLPSMELVEDKGGSSTNNDGAGGPSIFKASRSRHSTVRYRLVPEPTSPPRNVREAGKDGRKGAEEEKKWATAAGALLAGNAGDRGKGSVALPMTQVAPTERGRGNERGSYLLRLPSTNKKRGQSTTARLPHISHPFLNKMRAPRETAESSLSHPPKVPCVMPPLSTAPSRSTTQDSSSSVQEKLRRQPPPPPPLHPPQPPTQMMLHNSPRKRRSEVAAAAVDTQAEPEDVMKKVSSIIHRRLRQDTVREDGDGAAGQGGGRAMNDLERNRRRRSSLSSRINAAAAAAGQGSSSPKSQKARAGGVHTSLQQSSLCPSCRFSPAHSPRRVPAPPKWCQLGEHLAPTATSHLSSASATSHLPALT